MRIIRSSYDRKQDPWVCRWLMRPICARKSLGLWEQGIMVAVADLAMPFQSFQRWSVAAFLFCFTRFRSTFDNLTSLVSALRQIFFTIWGWYRNISWRPSVCVWIAFSGLFSRKPYIPFKYNDLVSVKAKFHDDASWIAYQAAFADYFGCRDFDSHQVSETKIFQSVLNYVHKCYGDIPHDVTALTLHDSINSHTINESNESC